MFVTSHLAIWIIAAVSVAGVIIRPFRIPGFVWAVCGAGLLIVFGLMARRSALTAAAKGTDVYLFLIGMMLLAEIARLNGDQLAIIAMRQARGSQRRLFVIIYAVGTIVTAVLSNDATAVVLTPAVYSVTRAAKVEPLPYLFICAFIANAASFVLPISNPANLVVFGDRMPPLMPWLQTFALPSLAAIVATFVALWLTQRRLLVAPIVQVERPSAWSAGAILSAAGIVITAGVLMAASALDWQLGLPTFLCGITVAVCTLAVSRASPWPVIRGVSWSVLPLVAGLFVLVEALNQTGVLAAVAESLRTYAAASPRQAVWVSGASVAVASNLVNNLPMGLMAAIVSDLAHAPHAVTSAILIGVDLGPNFSVTGSLATILWLIALRREQKDVTAMQFLKVGCVVTPPALISALVALSFGGS